MIEGAATLLSRRGLQATSFSEILAATGAPRGSLYHHFPGGKDELITEATRYVGDQVMAALERAEPTSPVAVVEAFTGLWRRVLVGSDLGAGCAVAAVAVDAGPDHLELATVAGSVFAAWRSKLADLLVEAGFDQERAPDVAVLLLAAMEGSLVVTRAQQDLDAFDRVVGQLVGVVVASD
jgi:AcrR family transcriptional regulator